MVSTVTPQATPSLTLPAPAKINLFLHINGRRADGYHELQTLFQILDFGDELTFTLTENDDIRVTPKIDGLAPQENIVYKAARELLPTRKIAKGIHIDIKKHLPMGGGVGGGSSDAATTLLALNELWQCDLSLSELSAIGLRLGADVPVFINGKTALAEGVGEHLSSVETPPYWYLILCPQVHVSTAEIFSNELLTRDTPKKKIAPALGGNTLSQLGNDCQELVSNLYPEIRTALTWLSQFGNAKLTGTGACCFCNFETEAEARQVLNEARSKFKGFVAQGVNTSPAHQRLNEAKAFARIASDEGSEK